MLHYQHTCVGFVLVPAAVCNDLLKLWHLFSLFLLFLEVNHVALFQCCMLSLSIAWVPSKKASYISVMFQTVYDGVLSCMLFINGYAWKNCSVQHYHQNPPSVSEHEITVSWLLNWCLHCSTVILELKCFQRRKNKSSISKCIWVATCYRTVHLLLESPVEIWFYYRHKVR